MWCTCSPTNRIGWLARIYAFVLRDGELHGGCPSLPYQYNAQAIEFLCDDFGAQVGGVSVSIHGLLKVGLSAEVECAVMQQAILSKVAGNFNPSDLNRCD